MSTVKVVTILKDLQIWLVKGHYPEIPCAPQDMSASSQTPNVPATKRETPCPWRPPDHCSSNWAELSLLRSLAYMD